MCSKMEAAKLRTSAAGLEEDQVSVCIFGLARNLIAPEAFSLMEKERERREVKNG